MISLRSAVSPARRLSIAASAWAVLLACAVRAATCYVSPNGNDGNDGTSTNAAWKTVAKVNGYAFAAGDRILFQRGGEWREALRPGASGVAGNPITFDAYGSGAKPMLWGSDVLVNANFTPAGGNSYTYNIPNLPSGGVYTLQNHQFLEPGRPPTTTRR